MVGVIEGHLSPYDMFKAVFGQEPKMASLNGDEVMYVYNNKVDCEYIDAVYSKDTKENRLNFFELIKDSNYNFLSSDLHSFLNMQDTETFYKIGGFNV